MLRELPPVSHLSSSRAASATAGDDRPGEKDLLLDFTNAEWINQRAGNGEVLSGIGQGDRRFRGPAGSTQGGSSHSADAAGANPVRRTRVEQRHWWDR